MRRLILKMSISIDGFVGGPNGEIDWVFRSMDEETSAWTMDTLWQTDLHIMGRKTYQDMAAYWPTSTQPFAAPMNEIPKIVFSKRGYINPPVEEYTTTAFKDALRINNISRSNISAANSVLEGKWINCKIISGDLSAEILLLKKQPGKDILAHGGAEFARSLIQLNLIDEFRLLVHPVVLGTGLPIFSAIPKATDLKLIESHKFSRGVIANIYRLT
jgi:dihydrofolate reductase